MLGYLHKNDLANLVFCKRRHTLVKFELLNQFLANVERRAFRIAEFSVGNTDDALDLVQDAMLKLAEKYAQKPPEQWPPLFYRILQSRIKDYFRRNKIQNRWRVRHSVNGAADLFGQAAENDVIQRVPDPHLPGQDQVLDSQIFTMALKKALQQLPERQRQVFLLRAWEGLDVKQTALAMGCSVGSVKTHYFRALQQLRNALTQFSTVIEL